MNKLFIKIKSPFKNVVYFDHSQIIYKTPLLSRQQGSTILINFHQNKKILTQHHNFIHDNNSKNCYDNFHGQFEKRLLKNIHNFNKRIVRKNSSSLQQQAKVIHSDDESLTIKDLKSSSSIIELDRYHLGELSKEFSQSINKSQLKYIWKDVPPLTISNAITYYSKLSKIKLTGLVVLTTLAGFYMGVETNFNLTLLASTLIGTALTSGSAAAWNHFLEVPFDSQMSRTQGRPLVQGFITPLHAASFAMFTGISGLTVLAICVNPLTALLGGLNLCLYSFVYTPLKRVHILNTWVGAIVGAIPPVMGFTAINNLIDLPSILFGLILYSWQFPHFNALSWNMRHEYARAGYRMMSVTDPKLCQNTALKHSMLLLGYVAAMCATDITHWSFCIDTLPFSLYLIYLSYLFRTQPSSQTSRKLFLYSLIYLPVIIFLMVISKNRNKNQDKKPIQDLSSKTKLERPY